MNNSDYESHVTGRSLYVDDITAPNGLLYASVFSSPSAHARISGIDISLAENLPGVKKIILADDIPGENQAGNVLPDEPLLAKDYVHYIGEPVALIVADDPVIARSAAKMITLELEELPAVFNPREAAFLGSLIIPPRLFSVGDCESVWSKCTFVVDGTAESGGQEHLYLETQSAVAWPSESRGIKLYSATQAPTAVQRITARILGISMNLVEVDVLRLGGGFGGKEEQATPYAAMTALAAYLLNKPVKMVLKRNEDMRMTGKRHPYSSDFKLGLDSQGKILAYEVTFYQNAGATADLSTAILDRSLFHCTNSYYIPNVKAIGYCCKTNLPTNTAFRGFGGPQAMFVIESAIHKAAKVMGVEPSFIQEKNLLRENDEFPYGQKAENCNAERCWKKAEYLFNFQEIKKNVEEYNQKNKFSKKGYALMPVCFGISFTTTFMNQAGALVHIYSDGSISISTAAVEMGQGVNAKIKQIAADIFSVNPNRIKIDTTNTSRVANTSPTAASSGTDLNGKATEIACVNLKYRLIKFFAAQNKITDLSSIEFSKESINIYGAPSGITWEKLISTAFLNRIDLSAHAFYSTPGIHFDNKINKGKPFAYHVYGTAVIEATLDCIRGTYKTNLVKVVHDFGKSLNRVIDRGQTEGAIVQGIGWMTMEELVYNEKGKLLTDLLSTYKIPDLYSVPEEMEIHFLEDTENPMGVFNSKAIGEPPLMYGIGAYFAIMNAVESAHPAKPLCYKAPLTYERVLLSLYDL